MSTPGPNFKRCALCLDYRPIAHFMREDGTINARCDECRGFLPLAVVRTCKDCGAKTTNRLYCSTCLKRRAEIGGYSGSEYGTVEGL